MSYALNNSAVAATTVNFTCTGAVKCNILVANAAVLMTPTFRNIAGADTTGAQIYLPPGFYSYRRPIDSIAFIEATTGMPALVTVEALLLAEANQ